MAEKGETEKATEEAGEEGATQVGGGESEQEPEEVFDPNQTYWLGYFRLPISDVKMSEPLTPNYSLLPKSARGKGQTPEDSELLRGTWVYWRKPKEGEEGNECGEEGKEKSLPVLVKPISSLRDREARILSSVAGSEANASTYNLTRFYGATLDEQLKEYCLVLENCDCYLQDLVMDKKKQQFNPKALCEEIAVGMRYLHWKAQYSPIIHRNLHPLSVLIKLDKEGTPHAKIHGFRHAKMLGKEPTAGGSTVAPNNPDVWCAPDLKEFTSGKQAHNLYLYAKVDVYSFAILVWHIFTRELPFEGKRMDELKLHKMIREGKKPVNLKHRNLSPFWRALVEKGLNAKGENRPDFMRIVKAIRNEAEDPAKAMQYLDSIAPEGQERSSHQGLEVEDDDQPQAVWEIGAEQLCVKEEHRIVPASDSKKKSSSVMEVTYEDGNQAALKKLTKRQHKPPSREEFEDYVLFSRGLDPQYALRCEGVLLPDSLKMPLMECSVRQYMKGKKWGEGRKAKQVRKGYGNMRQVQVRHVALSVCKGLKHLHEEKNAAHGSISSSNVLLSKVAGKPEDWVVLLVDYALKRLDIASQSHARYAPQDPSVDEKRADLYSLGNMIIEMFMGKLETKESASTFFDSNFPSMWPVVEICLDVHGCPNLTAAEVVEKLLHVETPH